MMLKKIILVSIAAWLHTESIFAQTHQQAAWSQNQSQWHAQLANLTNRDSLADQLHIPRAYLEVIYQSKQGHGLTPRDYSRSLVDPQGMKWIGVSIDPQFCLGRENTTTPVPEQWANEQIVSANALFEHLQIPIRLMRLDDLRQTGGIVMVQSKNTGAACFNPSADACSGYDANQAISCEIYPFIPLWKKIFMPGQRSNLLQHEGGHTFSQDHTDKIAGLPKDPRIKADASLHTVMNSQATWVEQYFVMPVGVLTRKSIEGRRGPLDELQTLLHYGTTAHLTSLPSYRVLSPEGEIAKNAFFHAFLPEIASYSVGAFVSQLAISNTNILIFTKAASFVSRLYLMEPWKGMVNFVLGISPSHVIQELSVPISHLADMHYFPIRTLLDFRYYSTSVLMNWGFELTGAIMGSWLGYGASRLLKDSWQRPSFFLNSQWTPNLFQAIQTHYQTRWEDKCPGFLCCLKPILIPLVAADRTLAAWILLAKKRLHVPSLRWYRSFTMPKNP